MMFRENALKISEECIMSVPRCDVSRGDMPNYLTLASFESAAERQKCTHTSQDLEEALQRLSGRVRQDTFAYYSSLKTLKRGSLVTANEQGVEQPHGSVHLSTYVLPSHFKPPVLPLEIM